MTDFTKRADRQLMNAHRTGVWVLSSALALLFGALGLTARGAAPAPQSLPAVWSPHALIVDLNSLPRAYNCRELWYRVRGVLLTIGADPESAKVVPYQCNSRSPSVEVQFALPETLKPDQGRLAEFEALEQTVTLGPGHPESLDRSDCELLRQIREQLLSQLPLKILGPGLECAGKSAGKTPYALQVRALRAADAGAPSQVATNSGPKPAGAAAVTSGTHPPS